MSYIRSRAATTYSGGTSTTTSTVNGYSSTLRKSRILVFSFLYHVAAPLGLGGQGQGQGLHGGQQRLVGLARAVLWVRLFVFIIEMLQLVSLALEPAFIDFGISGVNRGLYYFSRIRMPMPALASPTAHMAAIIILIVYLSLLIIAACKLAVMEEGTRPPHAGLLKAWGVLAIVAHPILYLPALSVLFSALHCGIVNLTGGDPLDSLSGLRNTFYTPGPTPPPPNITSSEFYFPESSSSSADFDDVTCGRGDGIALLVLSSLFLIITVVFFGILAFAEYGFAQRRRDKQFFGHTLSRLPLLLFILKTISTIYVQFSGDIVLTTRAALYQWGIMVYFVALAYYILYYVPFYHGAANAVYLSLFSISFMGALLGFITTRISDGMPVFVAFMVLLVPLILLSFLACHLRLRKYYQASSKVMSPGGKEFQCAFDVELYTRPAIEQNKSQDTIRSIFWRGLKEYPGDVDVQLAFMQYLLEDSNHFQMLTSTMEKVKKNKKRMTTDRKFLLHCIEKQRMSLALAMDGGIEEVSKSILSANNHAYRAKILVRNFWESLLHEEDLLLMPNMVAKLEHEESAADRAFLKLRARFPENVAVMRHYAQFLEEVKGDPDTSHELYKLAEYTEQETSTQHSYARDNPGLASSSLGTATGRIIEEIVVLEDVRVGKNKDKERDNCTPDTHETSDRPRHRVKKLLLDATGEFASDDSPRKSSPRPITPPPVANRTSNESDLLMPPMSASKSKYDLFRYRQYRDQAEVFRSHSVWKISSAINLTLLILLLNMVILFTATMVVLNAQRNSISQLSSMVDTRQNVATCISSTLRALRYSATNDSDSFSQDVATMQVAISYLANNTMDIYGQDESYGPVRRGWSSEIYHTYLWSYIREQTTGYGYIEENITTLDMLTDYTFWMQQASAFIARPNNVDSVWNSSSGRYVLENGLTSVTAGATRLVDLYEDKGRYTVSILQKITISLLPLSFFLVILLLWFLVRSAIREIQHERVTILKLFLAIPKDNILSIVSTYKSDKEGAAEEVDDLFSANEDEVSNFDSTVDYADGENQLAATIWMAKNSRLSMLRNFFLKFLLSLMAGFFLVVIAAALILAAIPDFNENIRSINVAGQRRTLVGHLHSTAMTLAYYAETTRAYPDLFNPELLYLTPTALRDIINQDVDLIQAADSALKFGHHGASSIQAYPYLIDLAYNQTCSPLSPYTYTCSGMNSLLVYIIALAQVVVVIPDTQLSFLTSQLQTLSDVSYRQLGPMLGKAVNYYRQVANDRIDEVSTSIIAIFVIIFPVLLIVNFILRPMVAKVKQEHKRTLRMLLMIPMSVIDNTPSIKEYLDSLTRRRHRIPWYKLGMLRGWGRSKTKKNNNVDDKYDLLQSHEPLLQAFGKDADEALLVVSGEGTIEMVGSSTQRILGYERRQLLGHRLATIFDNKSNEYLLHQLRQARNQEGVIKDISADLHAKTASDEYIPVALTITTLKENNKFYYGVYIRDITYLRTIETQMEKERAIVSAEQTKLKDLLLNVFPKSIAEQLLIKGEGSYQPQLIAEEYKEATVLFADIVGFTTMCSDLEPGALLLILDGIFTEWDALVEKHELQKIKTIGDCFMVAGGVPDRTVDHAEKVIDFAMDMTSALHRYNDTCNILRTRSLSLNIRIGINTGPVVAGIIGRSRMCFDLWGDAVNVASRMESTSIVGRIQVSQTTFNRVKNNYQFEERGTIEVKGKGAMLTYLLVAPRFLRTDSGKVIDNRFAQHMYHTPSGKSIPDTPSSTNSDNNNNNNNSNRTYTFNDTSPVASSSSSTAHARNNRRGSLGTASTPSFSPYPSPYSSSNTSTPSYTPYSNSLSSQSYHNNRRRGSTNTVLQPIPDHPSP